MRILFRRQLLYAELITKVHETALSDSLIPVVDPSSSVEGLKTVKIMHKKFNICS